jgi:hypothetical protein
MAKRSNYGRSVIIQALHYTYNHIYKIMQEYDYKHKQVLKADMFRQRLKQGLHAPIAT